MVLVDTGINVPQTKYLQLLAGLGIEPQRIALIVITHGHTDHFAQAKWLKELTGARLLCHKKALPALKTGKNPPLLARNRLGRDALRRIRLAQPGNYEPVEPDILIEEEYSLTSFGLRGKIIPTPGHTPCSLSLVLESGQALVGDLFVASPFTGKPCLAYFADDEEALLKSAESLSRIAEVFYSAHGGPFSREDVLRVLQREREKQASLAGR